MGEGDFEGSREAGKARRHVFARQEKGRLKWDTGPESEDPRNCFQNVGILSSSTDASKLD